MDEVTRTELRDVIAEARRLSELPPEQRDPDVIEAFMARKAELLARLDRF